VSVKRLTKIYEMIFFKSYTILFAKTSFTIIIFN